MEFDPSTGSGYNNLKMEQFDNLKMNQFENLKMS